MALLPRHRRLRFHLVKTSSVVTTRYTLRHAPMGFPADCQRAPAAAAVAPAPGGGTTSPFIESSAATYHQPRRRNAAGGRMVVAMCAVVTMISAYAALSFAP